MSRTDDTARPVHPGRAYLLLTVAAILWGANTVFARLAVGEVSPMVLVALRWLIVSLLLLGLARRQVVGDWAVVRPRLGYLLAMGGLGFGVWNWLYYAAAHSTTAVNMGIVQGAIPVFVLLGSFAIDRTRITVPRALGVAMGLLGVAVVASAGDVRRLLTLNVNPGDALMVFGCALYAGYIVALRRGPAVSPFVMLTVMAVAAFLISVPAAAVEWVAGNAQLPTTTGWVVILAIAVLPSLLGQAFFIQSVRLIGPGRAGLFINLVPVFAAILGVVFLSERFAGFHAVALALVLGGIWLSEREHRGLS